MSRFANSYMLNVTKKRVTPVAQWLRVTPINWYLRKKTRYNRLTLIQISAEVQKFEKNNKIKIKAGGHLEVANQVWLGRAESLV